MFYVYQYSNPITKIPFYIGKGHGPRGAVHIWYAKNHRMKNKHFENTINKILSDGHDPILEYLAEFDDEDKAYDLEKELINTIGRRIDGTGPLTNIDVGGRGGRKRSSQSEETRKKMSIAKTGKKLIRTPEHNLKIKMAHLKRQERLKGQSNGSIPI